jgi:hypothetical protein
MATATIKTITRKHPVREAFAGCSTTTDYYATKGHAVNAFDAELQTYDLCFDRNDLTGFDGDTGRKSLAVVDECDHVVGYAVLSWYRMPSGRYEFTGYLA